MNLAPAADRHARVGRWAAVGLCCVALVFGRGCDRGQPPAPDPRETIYQLIVAHDQRDYARLERLVIAPRRQVLVQTLRAADDFLAAEQRLRDAVRQDFGRDFAETIDLSGFARHLGVFSTNVKLLDQIVQGQTATVSYLVDGVPPARRATLRREGGRWLYDPGEGFDPALPATFARMAAVLDDTTAELRGRRDRIASIYADPQSFLRELGQRLSAATADLPSTRPTTSGLP